MIASLKGKLTYKNVNRVIIDVNGIGFDVYIPLSTFDKLPELEQELYLFIYTHITENSFGLYGFLTMVEKEFFLSLLPVNKIGPKVALSILSFYNYNQFKNFIIAEEVSELSKIPGVGKKTAERLIVELKDKIGKVNIDYSEMTVEEKKDNIINDAAMALSSLGFNYKDSLLIVQKIKKEKNDILLEDLIKQALGRLKSSAQ